MAQVTALARRHPARGHRPLVGQDHEDPFGDSVLDPALPGPGAAESPCPKGTLAGGREAAESACPSVRAADWVELEQPAVRSAARARALARVEAALTALYLPEAQTADLRGGAEGAFPHWK